ncbi:MAG: metallophosphoesterase [Opitutae bacterium]|nr:metallophosphoesterase [Opitutae bacterium]
MKGRLIAIGDIHGCHEEFAELLARLDLGKHDRLILLGDLVNRGPDSRRVIDLARRHRAIALLGNHELRLLNYRKTGNRAYLKEQDEQTHRQLRRSDWAYLAAMRLTYYCRELQTVFVHGGFVPTKSWRRQPAEIVTRIQVLDRDGAPHKRADCPRGTPWAKTWRGPPFVVYGHTPNPRIVRRKWSVCLDTGCVLGGRLTALILPEQRIVQVKARQEYYA